VRVEAVGEGVISAAAQATPLPGLDPTDTRVPAEVDRVAVSRSEAFAYVENAILGLQDPGKVGPSYAASLWTDELGAAFGFADRESLSKFMEANKAQLADEFFGFLFLHELGHTIGLPHHGYNQPRDVANAETFGDQTCIMCYWHLVGPTTFVPFASLRWNPAATALKLSSKAPVDPKHLKSVPWKVCVGGAAQGDRPCVSYLQLHR
jgi:hypothetical protein